MLLYHIRVSTSIAKSVRMIYLFQFTYRLGGIFETAFAAMRNKINHAFSKAPSSLFRFYLTRAHVVVVLICCCRWLRAETVVSAYWTLWFSMPRSRSFAHSEAFVDVPLFPTVSTSLCPLMMAAMAIAVILTVHH